MTTFKAEPMKQEVVPTLINGDMRKDHFISDVLLKGAVSGWLVSQYRTRRVGCQYYIHCGLPTGERVEFCVSNPYSFCVLDAGGCISANVDASAARKLHATLQAEVKRFRAAEARTIG